MIIDIHAHIGVDRVFDEENSEKEIIYAMDKNNIDATIVQTMFGIVEIEEIKKNHDRVYAFTQKYPNRIFGMVTTTPHINESDYFDEAKRCIKELGFVGIKLHTLAHAVNPASKLGGYVFEVCDELDIPLMVHTGTGIPFGAPALVLERAKEFPNLRCVLAHSGLIAFAGEAFIVARECPNVFLETSWTAPVHIEHMVREFGADRVMYASDMTRNIEHELMKFEGLNISTSEKEKCLFHTANNIYSLNL